jgi:hypothetical protein
MKHRILALGAAFGCTFAVASGAAFALPSCADLQTNPAYGLASNPQISALTAALQPASGPTTPYCRVDFTFSGESGPAAGYRAGQSEQIRIRVGLPPNSVDMTNPIAAGAVAWNGKNRDLGGGGYAGGVGGVTSSTNLGYIGTSTDTGHNSAVQPGGSFALNPDGSLNWGQIEDFALDGIHQQHVWGIKLAKTYYGSDPTRSYWMGCSTGGRQGHMQAQNFPKDYDGILAGANAFNWDRFITAELWPQVAMRAEVGGPIAGAKLNAVTNAAIAACDGLDGILDGILQDPRACTYSAKSFVCTASGGPSSDPNCLTPAEASAVDKIWDGPRDAGKHGPGPKGKKGQRAWFGLERGTPLNGLAGTNPFSIAVDHFRFWIHQDAAFDWHTVTEDSFFDDMLLSIDKFNDVIGTDDELKDFRKAGGKIITYHGLFDTLIPPRGTDHYYNNVLHGNYKETQKYYRHFQYPNNNHCGGGAGPRIDGEALFSALVNWVENGVEPDYIVATQPVSASDPTPLRTRKICMYPDVLVYNGSGSTDSEASFHCKTQKKDDLEDELEIGNRYKTKTKAISDPN